MVKNQVAPLRGPRAGNQAKDPGELRSPKPPLPVSPPVREPPLLSPELAADDEGKFFKGLNQRCARALCSLPTCLTSGSAAAELR